jgi:hypothetical protein
MNTITRIVAVLGMLLFNNTILWGQDIATAKGIIEKINNYYGKTPNFKTEVGYNLYKDHTSDETIERDTAVIVRFSGSTWFKMGAIETISDGKYDLMINHDDKVIVLSNYKDADAVKLPHLALDSLLKQCDQFKTDNYGAVGCLYLNFATSEAKGISICYNTADFSLYSLTTYYRNERKFDENPNARTYIPRLEIRYLKTDTSPKIETQRIKHTWFVKQSGKSFKATEKFKGYQIFNQII